MKYKGEMADEDMMLVNKDWGIRADSVCVTLYHKHKHKTGEDRWAVHGHYYNFRQAAVALANKAVQTCKSFKDMIERLEDVEKTITRLSVGHNTATESRWINS